MSNNDRFYKCINCGNLEDGFTNGILTNKKKLTCKKCHKPTKTNTINQIINFQKNRSLK